MDPTPLDATDDYLPTSQEGVWQAKAGTAPAGKMDLLSVLLHEYGHALGLAHSGAVGDFMNAALQSGQRRMPTAQQLQQMSDLVAQLRADFEPASAPGSASASASNQNSAPAQPALPGMPGDPDHPGYPLSLLGLLPLGLMRRSDGSMVRLSPYANPDSTPSSAVAQSVSVRAQDYMTAPYPHLTRGSFQNGLVDWEQAGAVSQQGGQSVTLGEAPGSTGQTRLAQAFVLNAQDRFLTFTVNNATLQNNSSADESAPQDAFEVALLNANTGTSLWTGANAGNGTYSGTSALSKTDALLSLQLASSALNASVQERATSVVSSKLNTDGSRTYLVDLRNIAAGNSGSNAGIAVNLSFDLIGFGTRSVGSGANTGSPTGAPSNTGSKVTLRDVRMISSPLAQSDAATVAEDASVSINVTANDLNADANLNEQGFGLQLVASAQHGHVELLAGGSFRYTPDANYYGQDSFTYRYSDGTASLEGTSEAARVTITITPVNDAPVAQDVTLTIAEDNTVTINLIAADADSALASLQFSIETQSVVERGTCLQAATTSRSAPTVLAAATRGLRCGTFLAWMPNPLSKRLCRCWGIYRWWIGCQ